MLKRDVPRLVLVAAVQECQEPNPETHPCHCRTCAFRWGGRFVPGVGLVPNSRLPYVRSGLCKNVLISEASAHILSFLYRV